MKKQHIKLSKADREYLEKLVSTGELAVRVYRRAIGLLELDRDAWAEIVLTDLERAHGDIRERVQRLDVMRWGHAMIQPVPGFRFGAARRLGSEPWRGIHFAHSDTSGLPLFEEAFERGLRVADAVAKRLKDDAGEEAA